MLLSILTLQHRLNVVVNCFYVASRETRHIFLSKNRIFCRFFLEFIKKFCNFVLENKRPPRLLFPEQKIGKISAVRRQILRKTKTAKTPMSHVLHTVLAAVSASGCKQARAIRSDSIKELTLMAHWQKQEKHFTSNI